MEIVRSPYLLILTVSFVFDFHTGSRDRRHSSMQRHHHHEYHKLNTRLIGSGGGYMEFSYSTTLYELVQQSLLNQRLGPGNSVSEWTMNFLSSRGFDAAEQNVNLYNTRYDVENNTIKQKDEEENLLQIIPLRHRRSPEESLERLRNRRANHAIISYCCEHRDSAKCSDWLCYI